MVADVRRSKRLVDSPCVLVHDAAAPSIQMEKIMRMANKDYSFSKRILEINPDNSLIEEMVAIHKGNPESEELKSLSLQLLENMLLREGLLENVEEAVPRIQDIMLMAARKTRR